MERGYKPKNWRLTHQLHAQADMDFATCLITASKRKPASTCRLARNGGSTTIGDPTKSQVCSHTYYEGRR